MRYRANRLYVPESSLTFTFLLVNVGVFLVFLTLSIFDYFKGSSFLTNFVSSFALSPRNVVENGAFWTVLTSMFAHLSFSHLLVNMISLFFIGSFVEKLIGRKRYFWFYIISGVVAGLFFVAFTYFGLNFSNGKLLFGGIDDMAVGASGALFGLGGLLAVILPRLPVLVFFVLPLPMWAAMAFLMVGLWLLSWAGGLPVGNTAHLGGLMAGLAYGLYLRLKYSNKVAHLNRIFSRDYGS